MQSKRKRRNRFPKYPSIGSISHGTLREADLLEAFADALEELRPRGRLESVSGTEKKSYRNASLIREARECAILLEDSDSAEKEALKRGISELELESLEQERAGELLQELEDSLSELAPEGVYFGASEGDGADFGFWPSAEWLERAEDFQGITEVCRSSDLSEVPSSFVGIVILSNCHGNVTVYYRHRNWRLEELWSAV